MFQEYANETIINAIANCTTAFSAIGLLIHIFGDPDNQIWDNRIKAWLAKIGLSITACGAVGNALTLSAPPITEVILNIGISITFFWLNWWQWEAFKQLQKHKRDLAAMLGKKIAQPRRPKRNAKRKTRVSTVRKDMEQVVTTNGAG